MRVTHSCTLMIFVPTIENILHNCNSCRNLLYWWHRKGGGTESDPLGPMRGKLEICELVERHCELAFSRYRSKFSPTLNMGMRDAMFTAEAHVSEMRRCRNYIRITLFHNYQNISNTSWKMILKTICYKRCAYLTFILCE